MLVKHKSTGRLYSAGRLTFIRPDDVGVRVLQALSRKDDDVFVVTENEFATYYEQTEVRPFVRHLRENGGYSWNIPFATAIATDSKTFYFSKCHWKDQYCKKEGIRIAMDNGPLTEKEFIEKVQSVNDFKYRKDSSLTIGWYVDLEDLVTTFVKEAKAYFKYFR